MLSDLTDCIHQGLLPALQLESIDPHNPVVVHRVPSPWTCLGTGNYAAVFAHPDYPDQVVKVYAPGRPGLEDEVEVYRRLGEAIVWGDLVRLSASGHCHSAPGDSRY